MSLTQKLEAVFRRTGTLLPGDVGRHLLALISPASLAIMAGVVGVWAASHFVGVGEVADVVLLLTGWLTIGGAALDGTRKMISFAIVAYGARTEADLNRAAQDLADAISILGVDVALGLLFKGRPKGTFKTLHGSMPSYKVFKSVMPAGGPTRMYEAKVIFTKAKFAGEGGTDPQNVARVGRDWVPGALSKAAARRNFRKGYYHERVHQRYNQGFSRLGRPALYLKLGSYKRSFILRYLEEAAAEARALWKVGGHVHPEPTWYEFPFDKRYQITLALIGHEVNGILLGPVTVGGAMYNAYFGSFDEHR